MVVKCRARGTRRSPTSCSRRRPGCSPRRGRRPSPPAGWRPRSARRRWPSTPTSAAWTSCSSHLWRLGFARFGEALDGPAVTGDPVADWVTQGWAYRRFALHNRHLYRVMFDDGLVASKVGDAADQEAAMATFVSLLTRLQRCADAGRWVDRRRPPRRRGGVGQRPRSHVDRAHRATSGTSGRDAEAAYGESHAPTGPRASATTPRARPLAGRRPPPGPRAGTPRPISGRSAWTPSAQAVSTR